MLKRSFISGYGFIVHVYKTVKLAIMPTVVIIRGYVPRTCGYTVVVYLMEYDMVKQTNVSSFFSVIPSVILERKRVTSENRPGPSSTKRRESIISGNWIFLGYRLV